MHNKAIQLVVLFLFFIPLSAFAQQEGSKSAQNSEKVKVGKKAADKYFKKRQKSKSESESSRGPASSGGARYMSLHLGTFLSDESYRWGSKDKEEDVGQWNLGVTYRVGEWVNSMDMLFRAELISYDVDNSDPLKLSLVPIIAFPDANSGFPLYFGAGLGLGVFLDQVSDESELSIDYQLIVGGRLVDLFDNFGLMLEFGYKNHFHLLDSGQFDGVFLSAGTVFVF